MNTMWSPSSAFLWTCQTRRRQAVVALAVGWLLGGSPVVAQDRVELPPTVSLRPSIRAALGPALGISLAPLEGRPMEILHIGGAGQTFLSVPTRFGEVNELFATGSDVLACSSSRCGFLALATGRIERVFEIPGRVHGAAPAGAGQLVLNVDVRTAERAGLPLHLIDAASGRIHSSFGQAAEGWRPGESLRRVFAVRDSVVWMSPEDRVELTRWRLDTGTEVGRLETEVDLASWPAVGPVRPAVRSMMVGEDGLSVLITVPDEDLVRSGEVPPMEMLIDPMSWSDVSDTVVLTFDLETGALLREQRFDFLSTSLGSDGAMYHFFRDGPLAFVGITRLKF